MCGAAGLERISSAVAKPSRPGMWTSSSTRSWRRMSSSGSGASPESTSVMSASRPFSRTSNAKRLRSSSSTTRMDGRVVFFDTGRCYETARAEVGTVAYLCQTPGGARLAVEQPLHDGDARPAHAEHLRDEVLGEVELVVTG